MKFYESNYYDNQVPILSLESFEPDGTAEGDTLAVNQKALTLTVFRKRFPADVRKEAIKRFFDPTGDRSLHLDDYTASEWETFFLAGEINITLI